MVVFPNCKINLGLRVLRRRSDGYHDIETVMFPVRWCDALEVVHDGSLRESTLTVTGAYAGPAEENLVWRALKLLSAERDIPRSRFHLHKNIPSGAGLGGGSSDAAFTLTLLNDLYDLGFSQDDLLKKAAGLGSDCAFFIANKPAVATGRGEVLRPIEVDLSAYYILIIHPGIHSPTASAYAGIVPREVYEPLAAIVQRPVIEWRALLKNDFEETVLKKFPVIQELKKAMYNQGALYAAMSGSGSAVFGIFTDRPGISGIVHPFYLQEPDRGVV